MLASACVHFLSRAERDRLQPCHFLAGIAMSEFNELQEAKGELQRRRNILRVLVTKYDELLQSSSPDSEEVLKARVGVAEARVGVAEAKVGVAEAKYDVAEAKGAPEATAEARVGVAEAKVGVAEAKYDVAEAKGSNPQKLERLQGEIVAKQAKYDELEGQFSSFDWGDFSFVDVHVHTLGACVGERESVCVGELDCMPRRVCCVREFMSAQSHA
jgi:chromosome segregation ATPase